MAPPPPVDVGGGGGLTIFVLFLLELAPLWCSCVTQYKMSEGGCGGWVFWSEIAFDKSEIQKSNHSKKSEIQEVRHSFIVETLI